jgi:hypothetical protein
MRFAPAAEALSLPAMSSTRVAMGLADVAEARRARRKGTLGE